MTQYQVYRVTNQIIKKRTGAVDEEDKDFAIQMMFHMRYLFRSHNDYELRQILMDRIDIYLERKECKKLDA
jgi:hypothetical protein